MQRWIMIAAIAAAALAGVWYINSSKQPGAVSGGGAAAAQTGDPIVEVKLPADLTPQEQMGKTAFDAKCAACHGDNAAGRVGMGPPFVHPIYRPGHHGDFAFVRAVEQGVTAHHWPFGNMPPREGLTKSDVANIIAYVRRLQRENGIN